MTLYLQNQGLIDLAAITTFGVSVKEGKNPIGFFGTGLKFAVAITARLGGKIVLYRGLERFDFQPRKLEVRGKGFDSLTMVPDAGERENLPFTTELGKLWEPWQAFRELYCNGLDEPDFTHGLERIRPQAGCTTIEIIDCAPLEQAYRDRAAYILETKSVTQTSAAAIHAEAGKGIYYRGVLVREMPASYSYNVTRQLLLTEDRTLKESWQAFSAIADVMRICRDSTMCTRIVSAMCNQNTLEHACVNNIYDAGTSSPEFIQACLSAYRRMGDRLPKRLRDLCQEARPEDFGPKKIRLSEFERRALEKAKRFLEVIGHPLTHEIVCVESLGEGVLGQAKEDTIWLSRICLDKGVKIIAGTLLEEELHLSMGFYDESREFQDYLLDRYITLAERHIYGEPL